MTDPDLKILFNFSTKWNNKLECNFFTTLRRSKHEVGETGLITLKNQPLFIGEIIKRVEIDLKTAKGEFLDYIGYLDTGYNWSETVKIIDKMYAGSAGKMYYYLVKKTKKTIQEAQLL
jgi:hypothetical protein